MNTEVAKPTEPGVLDRYTRHELIRAAVAVVTETASNFQIGSTPGAVSYIDKSLFDSASAFLQEAFANARNT